MNRNLSSLLPEVVDELGVAFKEVFESRIDDRGSFTPSAFECPVYLKHTVQTGWTPLKVVDLASRVFVRSTNRALVGLPLCAFVQLSMPVVQ